MNCLHLDQIYLFLEGELPPEEYRSVKNHISSCGHCRKAVQERKLLVEASQSLPNLEIPQDFTRRILDSIFPKRISLRDWVIAASVGLSSAVLAFFIIYLFSGQTLTDLFIHLNQTVLTLFENIVVVLTKAAKLVYVGFLVLFKIASLIITGLGSLTTILSPQFQIGLIAFAVIVSALLLFGIKRKFLAGEKV
jgi:hypothetical protein